MVRVAGKVGPENYQYVYDVEKENKESENVVQIEESKQIELKCEYNDNRYEFLTRM